MDAAPPAKTPLEELNDGTFREVSLPNGNPLGASRPHGIPSSARNIFTVLRDQANLQNAATLEHGKRIEAVEGTLRRIERDLADVDKLRRQVADLKRQLTAARLVMARIERAARAAK